MSKAGYEATIHLLEDGIEHYIKKDIYLSLPESNYPKDKIYGSHTGWSWSDLGNAYGRIGQLANGKSAG